MSKLFGNVSYQEVEEEDDKKSSLDVFLDDDKDKKDDGTDKDSKKDDKEVKEGDELEEDDKKDTPDDKKEDDDEIQLARVDYEELKKEFPELFKKFPSLKHAFFREQQFTEMFPTVEDAKLASDAQAQLEEITETVTSGNVVQFFEDLKTESEEGYKKFTSNFLPSLAKSDKDLYLDILSPELSRFIKNTYEFGVKEKDENIKNAAKIVRKVIFGGAYEDIEKEVAEPLIGSKKSPNEEKLEKQLAEEGQKKYNALYESVTKECYSALDSEISKGLADLKDKAGIQKLIAKDIRAQILEEMDKDGGYINRMSALWKKENRNGFSGTNKDSFKATFLAKAKAILPKIRAKVRKDTLGAEDIKKEENVNRPEAGKHSSGKEGTSKAIKEAAKTGNTKSIFDA